MKESSKTVAKMQRAEIAQQLRILRQRLDMTQAQFAETFWIPLYSLRQYEMARYMPPPATRSYLKVIAAEPEMVKRVLAR